MKTQEESRKISITNTRHSLNTEAMTNEMPVSGQLRRSLRPMKSMMKISSLKPNRLKPEKARKRIVKY